MVQSYKAEILADSRTPDGVRLTTFEVCFPRFILAEFNTHRMFSRNSASSRAIPTEKVIDAVITRPFVPETFNTRVKGMGVGEEISGWRSIAARGLWHGARWASLAASYGLMKLDVDKSRVNRLLEPFSWHTALVTATEWSNFFALRTDANAQPEFRRIAKMMEREYVTSNPVTLSYGQWHLPLVSFDEIINLKLDGFSIEAIKKISVGRCARVSYLTHAGVRDPYADIKLADRLSTNGHMSPFEHVARPWHELTINPWDQWSGNFRGWWQYRSEIPYQADFGALLAQRIPD